MVDILVLEQIYSNCLIENNTFTNSYASGFAGSVFINGGSDLNTTFVNNTFKNVLCANDTLFINVTNDSTRTIIENNSYDNCTLVLLVKHMRNSTIKKSRKL